MLSPKRFVKRMVGKLAHLLKPRNLFYSGDGQLQLTNGNTVLHHLKRIIDVAQCRSPQENEFVDSGKRDCVLPKRYAK
jgi:hypothetical protein